MNPPTDEFRFLFSRLELAQLFKLQALIEQSIRLKIIELELPELEVARLKHESINNKSAFIKE